MKIEISYEKGPIKICISDEFDGENILEQFKMIIEEIKKDSDFYVSFLEDYDENGILEKSPKILSERKSKHGFVATTSSFEQSEFPDKIIKLSTKTKISPEKLSNIFDIEEDEDPVYPFYNSININDTKYANQRTAVLLFLYQHNIIYNSKTMSSKKLTLLLKKSKMECSQLSEVFKDDKSGYITIKQRSYRITPTGIVEAKRILTELSV